MSEPEQPFRANSAEFTIGYTTEEIPQANVDAALKALGVPEEKWHELYSVTIEPREIHIKSFALSDQGGYQITHSSFGRSPSAVETTYKIVPER